MMRTYNYIIIDDEDLDRFAISAYLKKYPFLNHIASFSTAQDIEGFFMNKKIDILFLDIEMPGINGISFLKKVRDKIECPVFITSHSQYALDAFGLDAADYIIKPITQDKIAISLSKIKEKLDAKYKAGLFDQSFKNSSLLIKDGLEYVPCEISEVLYLQAKKDYTEVVALNKKPLTIHGNLASVLRDEKFSSFIRIHKSYAIQKNYIQKIGAQNITLINNIILPLGSAYKKEVMEKLS